MVLHFLQEPELDLASASEFEVASESYIGVGGEKWK